MAPSSVVVAFVGIPGLGKSAVCELLAQRLSGAATVDHFMSDKVRLWLGA